MQSVLSKMLFVAIGFLVGCSRVEVAVQSSVVTPYGIAPVCRSWSDAEIQPQLAWKFDLSQSRFSQFDQVMASPSVGDLNGDQIPEVVFSSFAGGAYSGIGSLRIISGKSGALKFEVQKIEGLFAAESSTDELHPFGSAQPLLIDMDRDGFAEIIVPAVRTASQSQTVLSHYVLALNYDGTFRWAVPTAASNLSRLGATAGDLDQNGKTQIVYGADIIEEVKSGSKYSAKISKKLLNANSTAESGANTLLVSLAEAKGSRLDIVTSTGVYSASGMLKFKFCSDGLVASTAGEAGQCLTTGAALGGFVAVGDLYPEISGKEIVVTGGGRFHIFNGLTGALLGPAPEHRDLAEHSETTKCASGKIGGGQATIGDFTGRGSAEIAIATGRSLTIFDKTGRVVAGSTTVDCSSLSTGITSFDFNGDQTPEILYGDEQYLRIYTYDGTPELKVVWQTPNPSGTLQEYPIVADVDGDGSADILMPANNYACPAVLNAQGQVTGAGGVCASMPAEDQIAASAITGMRLFKSVERGAWMPTRPIWNQGSYFVSNVGYELNGVFTDRMIASASTSYSQDLASIFKRNVQGEHSYNCSPAN